MSEWLAREWLAAVFDVSIQFTVLVAVVAAALFILRSLPPRVRHAVWLVVLLRLAIPAGLTSPWGVLPASVAGPPSAAFPAPADVAPANRLPMSEGSGASGSDTVVAGSPTPSGAVGSPTSSEAAMSPAGLLFMAWGFGVLGLLTAQVVRAARRRRRLAAVMEPLPADVRRKIDQLRARLGMLRPVDARVVRDEAISGPAIQGFLRPRILLPSSLIESWRRDELNPVLLHELIHIRRLDPAVRALANLLQIAWFFHPLAWWVGRRLGEEREKACDDAVVRRLRGEKRPRGAGTALGDARRRSGRGGTPRPVRGRCRRGPPETVSGGARSRPFRPDYCCATIKHWDYLKAGLEPRQLSCPRRSTSFDSLPRNARSVERPSGSSAAAARGSAEHRFC